MDQLSVPGLSGQNDPYLDARQAADYPCISAKKLLQLARAHKVPAYGLGGRPEKCGGSGVLNSIGGCKRRYTQAATSAVFKKGVSNIETVLLVTMQPWSRT